MKSLEKTILKTSFVETHEWNYSNGRLDSVEYVQHESLDTFMVSRYSVEGLIHNTILSLAVM